MKTYSISLVSDTGQALNMVESDNIEEIMPIFQEGAMKVILGDPDLREFYKNGILVKLLNNYPKKVIGIAGYNFVEEAAHYGAGMVN